MHNQRQTPALRAHIDKLIAGGWSITGREPVRLERAGWPAQVVRAGMLIEEAR